MPLFFLKKANEQIINNTGFRRTHGRTSMNLYDPFGSEGKTKQNKKKNKKPKKKKSKKSTKQNITKRKSKQTEETKSKTK